MHYFSFSYCDLIILLSHMYTDFICLCTNALLNTPTNIPRYTSIQIWPCTLIYLFIEMYKQILKKLKTCRFLYLTCMFIELHFKLYVY